MRFQYSAGFAAFCAITMLAASSPGAHAQTIYTNEALWQAAVPVNTSFTFEGLAPANGLIEDSVISIPGLTFSLPAYGGDPNTYILGANGLGGSYSLNGTADVMAGLVSASSSAVTPHFGITYDQQVNAVGLEVGFRMSGNAGVMDTFNAQLFENGTQVGSTYTSSLLHTGFIGFTSAQPFNEIVLSATPDISTTYMVYDNLAFGPEATSTTPEPGAVALGISMLLTATGLRRRRSRTSTNTKLPG